MSDLAELEQMAREEFERYVGRTAPQMLPKQEARPRRAKLILPGLYLVFATWFLLYWFLGFGP